MYLMHFYHNQFNPCACVDSRLYFKLLVLAKLDSCSYIVLAIPVLYYDKLPS